MSQAAPRPSVVLHGFQGGIVYTAEIAVRLAEVVVGCVPVGEKSSGSLHLKAQDNGTTWLIAEAGKGARSCRIEIAKSDATVHWLEGGEPSAALPTEEAASRFAAVLADGASPIAKMYPQSPFLVTDCGETWIVRGSGNADRAVEGPGPFHLEVQKRDARILDMYFQAVIHSPPEVNELLRAAAARAKDS